MAPALCLEGFHLQHRRKSEAEPEGPGAEEMELRVQGDWSSQHRALGRGERRGRLRDLQNMLQSADQHMGVGKPPKWKQPKGGLVHGAHINLGIASSHQPNPEDAVTPGMLGRVP